MSQIEKRDTGPDDEISVENITVAGRTSSENQHAISKVEIQLAAAYVSDAQYNRNILFDRSPEGIRLYRLYNHWGLLSITYIFIVVDLALAIFEEPAVVPLPIWATSLVEFLCLLAFTGRLIHFAKVIPRKSFWKDAKNICIIVTILLTLVDMIIYGSLKVTGYYGGRWSRVLRPLFLVNITESRQVRRAFRSIRNTLPQILYVFLLFIFSVLMFSLMALKLFGKRNYLTIEGKPYFTNYLEVVFNLYVLVTTANSPDVMMPAYNNNTWFSIFFILYIIINTYVFMSVFLAVIYNNYKKHLKTMPVEMVVSVLQSVAKGEWFGASQEEVKQLVSVKRHKMVKAFKVLQECEGNEYIVRQSHWNQLVKMVEPSISNAYRELLWSVSDDEQKGYIGKVAFVQLADLLNIRVITTKARIHPLQTWLPGLYHSAGSRLIHKMVQHKYVFQYLTGGYNSQQVLDIVFILRVLRLIRIVDSIKRVLRLIRIVDSIKSGFTMVTHISAILYFIIFHIVVVIIILNIFIAFILEAFFVEYTVEKSNVQTSIEKKIQELQLGIQEDQLEGTLCNDMETPDNDLGPTENTKVKPTLMFEIASKRYRTADALLQRIFQADLSPDDDGSPLDESDEDSLPADFNFQNPAFDSV
ncbi:UNVERIFIED_CONTAM: hypothetical protein FKN15_044694 [Acipenser sinensis]